MRTLNEHSLNAVSGGSQWRTVTLPVITMPIEFTGYPDDQPYIPGPVIVPPPLKTDRDL